MAKTFMKAFETKNWSSTKVFFTEDQCDLFCGDGACLTNFLSQKVCVCAQSTVKLDDGTCKG